jgi:hypothetical protein
MLSDGYSECLCITKVVEPVANTLYPCLFNLHIYHSSWLQLSLTYPTSSDFHFPLLNQTFKEVQYMTFFSFSIYILYNLQNIHQVCFQSLFLFMCLSCVMFLDSFSLLYYDPNNAAPTKLQTTALIFKIGHPKH